MFENIMKIFKKSNKKETKTSNSSKDAAKERLHLVLMQDRANVSADFLELMKQEIIDVIKKYIDVDESAIDVRLTNKDNGDGTNGAPALYANIPILNIKNDARKMETSKDDKKEESKKEAEKEVEKEVEKDQEKIETKKEKENKEKDNNKQEEAEQNNNKEVKENKEDSKEEIKSEN